MVGANPMVVPELPDESRFRARLRRSGPRGEWAATQPDSSCLARPLRGLLPGEPGAGLTPEMPRRQLPSADEQREILG